MESIQSNPILEFHPNTLEYIRKCWNLKDGRMKLSVKLLKDWVSKQNHFVNKNLSPEYLERTLIASKGSVEKAKSQIDKLCTLKTLLPRYFIGGDVKKIVGYVTTSVWITPLPKLTNEQYRVIIEKVIPINYTAAEFFGFYQLCTVYCEYLKRHDYCNGFVLILDYREANLLEIVTKMNVVEFQHFVNILMDGYGARLRGIHILNRSKFIDMFVKTFKPLIKAKIARRIHVHSNLEELHSVVDVNLLPEDYGGKEKPIEILKNEWFDLISSEDHEKYLAEMKASCTDESVRSTAKYNEQIMGLPGSFRTLTVD